MPRLDIQTCHCFLPHSGDPLSNTIIEFTDQEDAVSYCEKNGKYSRIIGVYVV